MNLAIVDISSKNHSSLVENWIRLAIFNNWKVSLFVSEDVLGNLDRELVSRSSLFTYKGQGARLFLDSVYDASKSGNIDRVVITSLQSQYISFLFSKLRKCKYLITIHNVNAWCGICRKDTIKYLIKYAVRKLYLRSADALLVSSSNLAKQLVDILNVDKKIYIMPFRLLCDAPDKAPKEYVVYPGMVSSDRKSYDTFYKLCINNPDVRFVLLGKASSHKDEALVSKFSELDNVTTFRSYVPMSTFEYYLNRSLVIFGDLNVNYESFEYKEIYGRTKDTGLSYFSVENSVPLLVNREFVNISNLEDMTCYFDEFSDAESKLRAIISSSIQFSFASAIEYSLPYLATKLRKI